MRTLKDLKVKIFADGADKKGMLDLNANPLIKGLTTNPTLMRKAGISQFEAFARDILQNITVKPVSFEVFSDEFPEMKRQAMKINSWAKNVYVKIPITNTRDESSLPLIRELANEGVKLNITAMLTTKQVEGCAQALHAKAPAFISVFAGRIADTGTDPIPLMRECKAILEGPAAGGVALGQRPRGAEYFPGGRLRLRDRDRAARHFEQGAQNGRDRLEGTLARHSENVRHRREGRGIFFVGAEVTRLKSASSPFQKRLRF